MSIPSDPSEAVKVWIEALESGRYAQAQGQLRHGDSFCCLGVMCDLVAPNDWTYDHFRGYSSLPPDEVSTAFGVTQSQVDGYAEMNDGEATFKEIAAAIRQDFGV